MTLVGTKLVINVIPAFWYQLLKSITLRNPKQCIVSFTLIQGFVHTDRNGKETLTFLEIHLEMQEYPVPCCWYKSVPGTTRGPNLSLDRD